MKFVKNDPRLMGKNNPRWNNTKIAGWQRAKKLYSLEPCELCGRDDNIHRHHKDGDKLNNTKKNIQFLCPPCHIKEEKKLGVKYGRSKKINLNQKEFFQLYEELGTWQQVANHLHIDIRTVFNYKKLYA